MPAQGQVNKNLYNTDMSKHIHIYPLIALAMLAMLTALWAGLLRMGWSLPELNTGLAMQHGPLMVSGFLGTLVILERAVALGKKWMFAAPALTGLGWVALHVFPGQLPGAILLTLGSLGGVVIMMVIVRRETQIFTVTILVGTLIWFISNLMWTLGEPIFQIVFWWQAFLVLTIAGERLELNRVLRPTRLAIFLFTAAVTIYLSGVLLSTFVLNWGTRLAGVGMLTLAIWFLSHDIALRNIHHPWALTRYIAWCLTIGFVWLAVGGIFSLTFGAMYAGPLYDAALHSVFVGFVISMIFGHAPIIFPAILGIPIAFQRSFYVQLILLHLSLGIRIAGDLLSNQLIRQWGGLLNEVALLIFLAQTIYSLPKGRKA